MQYTVRDTTSLSVLTPALRRLLRLILVLAGLLAIDSLYLLAVTVSEGITGETLQNSTYLTLFLVHLGLGLLLVVPALTFGALHFRRARRRPNRYALRLGAALYLTLIALFASGLLLTRFGFLEINNPGVRNAAYWVHLITPLLALWLFVLHRLAGPPLRWRLGAAWAGAGAGFTALAVALHLQAAAGPAGSGSGAAPERAFAPALARVPAGGPIPAEHLMGDAVCAECHTEIAARHAGSMHRFSSFNNPAYRKVIEDTRAELLARDGDVHATRLCAVCHDPVPLFSDRFDDPAYDPGQDPAAEAGITCLACHAITVVSSPRGNGDYRLVDPPRYPFAFSEQPILRAINRQLIKAKPAFHQQTMLKPVHRAPEFCSACHKVHLPEALNHYRWLRGQNHADSFRLSGVSGHRVDSFSYPAAAESGCNGCHMPARAADDPAAPLRTGDGKRAVHDHLFAAANTAVADWAGRPAEENAARVRMMQRAARIDLFGIKEGGTIDGRLHAPLDPVRPVLAPGGRYLLEVVVRTQGIGHALTQGTADSNEVWLELGAHLEGPDGERVIGRSGALDAEGAVDDWAWFGNAYLLDRHGERITRRNAHDIFVALYDHQIPPGAAAVVHSLLEVPGEAAGTIRLEARLRYRKFDTHFVRYLLGDAFTVNDLPITTLASDRIRLPVAHRGALPVPRPTAPDTSARPPEGSVDAMPAGAPAQGHGAGRANSTTAAAVREADPRADESGSKDPAWERWNDYGIGLLREGKRGESRQAEAAFRRVESLGSADGPLNLARVLHREGRLDEAAAALARAADRQYPHGSAPAWVIAWYTALIARDLGDLDRAIIALEALAETRFNAARARGFDFARDDRMLVAFGRTLFERARRERGAARREARRALLQRARTRLQQALAVDPESASAHHNLSLVLAALGDPDAAAEHQRLHQRYRADDNAVERAVSLHRSRNPAADHAAEPVAIYALEPAPAARAGAGDRL